MNYLSFRGNAVPTPGGEMFRFYGVYTNTGIGWAPGEIENPVIEPNTAKTAFFNALLSSYIEGFEEYAIGTLNPIIDFDGSPITAPTTGITIQTNGGGGDKVNTYPVGGVRQAENTFDSSIRIFGPFSQPIAAIAFSMMDAQDFSARHYCKITTATGSIHYLRIHRYNETAAVDLSFRYWGIIYKAGFVKIEIITDSVLSQDDAPANSDDSFVFDGIAIALASQIKPDFTQVNSPYSSHESVNWVRFDQLLNSNRFQDIGIDLDDPPTPLPVFDSVLDSISAGTFQNLPRPLGSGFYRIVNGSHVTIEVNTIAKVVKDEILTPGYQYLTTDFYVRRTGASVGNGRLLYQNKVIEVNIDVLGQLVVSWPCRKSSGGPVTLFTQTLTSTSLPLNEWRAIRLVMGSFTYNFFQDTRARFLIYVEGSANASFSQPADTGETIELESVIGPVGNVIIGGESNTNYANADIFEVRFQMLPCVEPSTPYPLPLTAPERFPL